MNEPYKYFLAIVLGGFLASIAILHLTGDVELSAGVILGIGYAYYLEIKDAGRQQFGGEAR